jgi:transposase
MSDICGVGLLQDMKPPNAKKLCLVSLSDLRKRVVAAVLNGSSQTDAARLLGVTRQTVNLWMAQYRREGEASLTYARRGRRKGSGRLNPSQRKQVARAILDAHPDQLKLPFHLWTREAVRMLIQRRFKVKLALSSVGRLLRQLNFTPQRPARRAREQNSLAVLHWMEERYPAVRAEAARRGATILWEDEMGLRSDDQLGRTWGLRGHTPVVEVTGNRFKCNMISALSNRGRLYFSVFKDSFNKDVFLEFLGRLLKQVKRPIILIVDGHAVHRSKAVETFVTQQQGRLQLVFLPTYSPELNPDEMLNQDVKTNTVRKQRPENQDQMVDQVRGYLRSRQKQPDLVKRYFHNKNVRYAAA